MNNAQRPEFKAALRKANLNPRAPQPLCKGREAEYVDYPASMTPDEREAEALCEECPLLSLCNSSAKQERPAWGVQGGIAWDMGIQVHWRKKLSRKVDT